MKRIVQTVQRFNQTIRFLSDKRTILLLAIGLCVGCGDFFEKRPTEIESMRVLQELRQVRESREVGNPIPDLYLQPPSRLEIKDGVKVFYFTRHHSAEYLADLVRQQMNVQAVPRGPTNQLVLYCQDHPQADALLLYLEKVDVPPIQVNVDCLILERFGDITMDWETSVFIENFLGEDLTLGEKLATFFYGKSADGKYYAIKNGKVFQIDPADYLGVPLDSFRGGELLNLDPAFPGASLRETERAKFGADFGYWMDRWVPGHQVRAVVDVLISQGYLKILLNPTLETVNGKEATVTIRDYTPIEKVKTGLGGASDAYNITEYVWVEDTLTVTPTVYSDGTIGLTTSIRIGSRSKPEGVVQRSIITERSIQVAENRVKPGESLVIGGMRKSEKRSVVRGIPFFKDLPILGILFSSKDFEEKGTEIFFVLTPSISSGGRDHSVVTEEIRRKHEKPQVEMGLDKVIGEPFWGGSYTKVIEKKAAKTEVDRLKAEADRDEALRRLEEEQQKALQAREEAQRIRKQAADLQKEADQAQLRARSANETATVTRQQRQMDQKRIEELSEQARIAMEEAQQIEAQVRQARQQAAEAEERARRQAERVKSAQEAVEQSQQELEAVENQMQAPPAPALSD
jgi:hypothetical protein